MGQHLRENTLGDLAFLRTQRTGEQPPGHEIKPRRVARAALFEGKLREMASRLDELRVVQGNERLQWRVGALAPHSAGFPARGVEDFHGSRRRGTFPEGVHASAIKAVPG